MNFNDTLAFADAPIDFDAMGRDLHPPMLPAVTEAFDGMDMQAVTAAALADSTPMADRTNVVDMFYRRPGIQRSLNLIVATMVRGQFDHLLDGDNDHVG